LKALLPLQVTFNQSALNSQAWYQHFKFSGNTGRWQAEEDKFAAKPFTYEAASIPEILEKIATFETSDDLRQEKYRAHSVLLEQVLEILPKINYPYLKSESELSKEDFLLALVLSSCFQQELWPRIQEKIDYLHSKPDSFSETSVAELLNELKLPPEIFKLFFTSTERKKLELELDKKRTTHESLQIIEHAMDYLKEGEQYIDDSNISSFKSDTKSNLRALFM
jgi:hypothetical protein